VNDSYGWPQLPRQNLCRRRRRSRRGRRRPTAHYWPGSSLTIRACAACCSTNQPWSLAPTPRGVEIVGGSFFESVPAGGDAYLLKSILHDWQDEPAIEILRTCRRAARTGTALLVIERQFALPATKLSDLNMLVGPGGRERTAEEYAALLAAAGYELIGETPTAAEVSVFEARAI